MRHTLIALLPWMVMAVGSAQERPATIRYTHLGSYDKEAVRFGDEVFVPIDVAAQWGWQVQVNEGMADIQAEGRLVKVVARNGQRHTVIPLIQALQQLGARVDWADETTLNVRGVVRNVEVSREGIRIDATMGFSPRLVRPASGQIAIELEGAWVDPKAKFDLPAGVTLKQIEPGLARLSIERAGVDGVILPSMRPGRSLDLKLAGVVLRDTPVAPAIPEKLDPASFAPRKTDVEPPPTEGQEGANVTTPTEVPPPVPVVTAADPVIQGETETGTVLVIPFTGTLPNRPTASYADPKTIALVIPGARYEGQPELASEFITSLTLGDDGKGSLRIDVGLKRAMAFELGVSNGAVRLRLIKPKVSGKLSGKVIVVDAGHGGHDSGARGGSGTAVLEKNLTLSIAKLLAKELTAQGASVIMTRSDDTFIPLRERPGIANRAKADFFISVHINSNNVNNKTSGQISFYHMQDAMGILLAECIQSEMKKVSGLPSMGTWSDSRIYKNGGFAVLKYATMPAVLLELGFINHDTDRKVMQTEKFQIDTARAIVRGVKTFLGGASGE
ncbi:MAG: N-acetylmuramoyl-L-alanine amidase [Fimbriimonadaceae bacterium]|nr:N-acetylmuramoyl-L-alanine amidase [Fimbriimonadaceae bacterium]